MPVCVGLANGGVFLEATDADMDEEVIVALGDGGPETGVEYPVGVGGGGSQVRNPGGRLDFPGDFGG